MKTISRRSREQSRLNLLPGTWYETVALPYARPFSRRQLITFGISLGFVILALNLYAPSGPTPIQRLLASLTIVLASVPVLLWLSGRDRGIPFMPFFAAIYAVYYALSIFLINEYTHSAYKNIPLSDSSIEQALMLSLLGLGFVFIGYYGFHQRAIARIVPSFNMQWKSYGKVKQLSIIFGIIGLSIYYIKILIPIAVNIRQIVAYATDLVVISIIILFVLQLTGRLGILGMGFLWVFLVPCRVLLGLGTGATFQGIQILLLLIFIYATLKHLMPWKAMLVGFVMLIILRSGMGEFRDQSWGVGEMGDMSPTENVALFLKVAKDSFTGEYQSYSDAKEFSLRRTNSLLIFAEVVEATPASVPFWRGETYYPLLFKPIPRFLYPGKPIEMTGQTFGHRYGFIHELDTMTSVNLPQLVELYINFGKVGVILGAFFIGTLYRIVQHLFIHREMGIGAVVACIYIFNILLVMETGTSQVFGGAFWALIYMGLLHQLIKKNRLERGVAYNRSV
ncbi:MAG: hypothetical protein ACE5KZ_07295 [Candidatus Scalinduaceae bacterium]